MKINDQDQTVLENLSALHDGEITSAERDLLLDRLLGDPDLLQLWRRHQLTHDALHEQLSEQLLTTNLLDRVSSALDDEPAYQIEHAVKHTLNKSSAAHDNGPAEVREHEQLIKPGWFAQLMSNRVVTGTSVAASVMFATLFTVQHLQNNQQAALATIAKTGSVETFQGQTRTAQTNPTQISGRSSSPALAVSLPANLVSTSNQAAVQNTPMSGQGSNFTWIKADPRLSQQIQKYVREHETHAAASSFNSSFTPRVRAVSFQPEQ